MLTPIKRTNEEAFQAPQISSFDVIDSDVPKIREGVHEIQQLFSDRDREFQYEEQMIYNSRKPKSTPAPAQSEYYVQNQNYNGQISPIRTEDESEYRDKMEFSRRMAIAKPMPVMTNLRINQQQQQQQQKENYDEPVFGRIPGSGFNSARTIYTPRTNEYSERFYENNPNGGMKTEIKFMIGRLMKVKNKIDKQTEQLNMSRISRSPSRPNSISPHSRRNSYATNGQISARGGNSKIGKELNLRRAETFQAGPLQESIKMERKYVTENQGQGQGRYY